MRASWKTCLAPVEAMASSSSRSPPSSDDITGATSAYALMPDDTSSRSASILASGSGAPGSVISDVLRSMVVIVTPTRQSISDRMGMSRMIRSDLVWMCTWRLLSLRTSRHIWDSLNLLSAYW